MLLEHELQLFVDTDGTELLSRLKGIALASLGPIQKGTKFQT